jgi:hypothetical protein
MHTRRIQIAAALAAATVLTVASPASSQEQAAPPAVVRAFVAAFNERSIDDMLKLASDDVEWLSVNAGKISIVTAGKQALQMSMMAYFKSCATCRSEIEISGSTATRVAAIETASWQGKNGSQRQSSLSVYELEAGLIRRVYYYPVEK